MTSKIQITGVIIGIIFLLPNLASAADESLGKAKLAVCATCHGLNGSSPNPSRPNLAGQDADYIVSSHP